jgi:hypothetical protein
MTRKVGMKVKYNKYGKEILSKALLNLGYLPGLEKGVYKDEVFNVYGIAIYKSNTYYLILPQIGGAPNFYKASDFIIINNFLPPLFYFQLFGEDDPFGYELIIGYKELTLDRSHLEKLVNYDEEAINIFISRKNEIDNLEDIISEP